MVGDEELAESSIEFFVDDDNFTEIIEFIKRKDKKTKRILYEIKQNRINENLYEKIKGQLDITAFRYGGSENFRIYCRDYTDGNRRIILMVLHHKKSYGFSKKETTLINTIKKYEYELK